MVGEQPEERADAVRVSAQDHLPVGGVHDAEGEDSVQLGRHGLRPQLVVQVNQRLAVTLRAHLEVVCLVQLEKANKTGCINDCSLVRD